MNRFLKQAFVATVVAALSLLPPGSAAAQECTWGGVPTGTPPTATALRSYGQFQRAPSRVAVNTAGTVYTTDPGTGQILIRDRYGRPQAALEGFKSPLAIAVDAAGSIYVGEQGTGSVTVFDPHGTLLRELGRGSGEFGLPNDIALDPDPNYGWIYIVDSGTHQVRVYDSDGTARFTFGGKGASAGQFNFPVAAYVTIRGDGARSSSPIRTTTGFRSSIGPGPSSGASGAGAA
jgi:DNA-binding beta-propeller fold protein YncE